MGKNAFRTTDEYKEYLRLQTIYMNKLDLTDDQLRRWQEVTGYRENTINRWVEGKIRVNQSAMYALWGVCTAEQLRRVEDLDINEFAAERARKPNTRGTNRHRVVHDPLPPPEPDASALTQLALANARIDELERELDEAVADHDKTLRQLTECQTAFRMLSSKPATVTGPPAPPESYMKELFAWWMKS